MSLEGNVDSSPAEPAGDISGIDVDALMTQIEGGQETNQPAPAAQPAATPAAAPTPAATAAEIEFTWNGKAIKAPLDKAKTWAAQGYDYAQKMQEFSQQKAAFQAREQQIKELESRYKPVEDYVTQNKEWWDHVNQEWKTKQAGLNPGDTNFKPILDKFQTLESKLGEIEQFKQNLESKEVEAKRSQEDQELTQEIQSIRESYKNLDWANVDAQGKSLEIRVLEHASQNGIKSFRAAFRDFHHDQLMSLAQQQAKESVVKERQKATKLGLLGQNSAPKKGITNAQDIKNKTLDQLIAEGVDELGLGA